MSLWASYQLGFPRFDSFNTCLSRAFFGLLTSNFSPHFARLFGLICSPELTKYCAHRFVTHPVFDFWPADHFNYSSPRPSIDVKSIRLTRRRRDRDFCSAYLATFSFPGDCVETFKLWSDVLVDIMREPASRRFLEAS